MLRQMLVPLAFAITGMTAVVWLTQSLDMIDLVVNRGQSALTFAKLSVLILPFLLSNILPIAIFVAVLYGLHHLREDSELVVMNASGVSRWGLLWPVVVFGLAGTIVGYSLNLYFTPLGYRTMKDMVYEIREDLAGLLLREGEFINPADGVTVYIGSAPPGGDLFDIMVHNSRDEDQPLTYLARRGALLRTEAGPRLVMENGTIIAEQEGEGNVSLLQFDSYTFDLSQFMQERGPHSRDLSERFLGELLNPDLSRQWDRRNMDRLTAEAHDRLSNPLYNLALALIPFVAVVCGVFNRRGYAGRIALAMGAAVGVRLTGFGAQALVGSDPILVPLLYLIPLGSIFVCLLLVGGWIGNPFAKRLEVPGEPHAEGA